MNRRGTGDEQKMHRRGTGNAQEMHRRCTGDAQEERPGDGQKRRSYIVTELRRKERQTMVLR
jgi:hypothetical protein